jgi:hypothetical protein
MNSHTTYLVFGPSATLKRMSTKMFTEYPPKFLHSRNFESLQTNMDVAVYEEYEKQINSSITLTCIFETTPQHNKIVLKKTGGRMGFRGSSLTEQQKIEESVMDFIFDFAKRYGLTVQEETVSDTKEEE